LGPTPDDSQSEASTDLWGVESRIEFGVAAFSMAAGALPSIARWAWVLVGSPVDLEGGLERMKRVQAKGCLRSPLATVLAFSNDVNRQTNRPLNDNWEGFLGSAYKYPARKGSPLSIHDRILNAAVVRPIFRRERTRADKMRYYFPEESSA